jgi:hypothetical protein
MRSSALIVLLACAASARADVLEGQVTTLLSGRSDPRDGNIYTVVPIYQALHATLRDVNVGRATGWVDDLRLEVSVWGGGLLGQPIGGQQAIGDVDVGYLEARLLRRRVSLRLGRQVVTGGAARFSHIDGAMLGVQLFRGLELQVWGGVPAIPRFGVRPGEAAAGARLLYRFGFSNQIGLSFAHLQDLGRAARQDIALDFLAQPHRTVSLSGLGVLSLLELRLVEADVGITWQPLRILDVRADWRRQSPDLFIPRSSIFSVFSQETRDEFGAQVSLRPDGRVDLNADYHTIIDPTGTGHRAAIKGALRLGPLHQMTVGAQLRLLRLPTNGYYQARLFALWRLGHGLTASVDADAYLFDQPINGESFSFVGAASLGWDFKPAWRILASGAAHTTPFQIGGWEAVLKLAYNPVFRFREGGK